jgi:L-arabinose isomerase
MPGMGDILTDPHAFMRRLGPQVDHVNIGLIAKAMEGVKGAEIDAVIAANRKNFEIDEAITDESHRYAARLQVAIKAVVDAGGYDAWSLYFDQIGLDGRFRQTHMMAASNLMAEGYGYSAEGDSSCASLMVAGYGLAPIRTLPRCTPWTSRSTPCCKATWARAIGRSPARTANPA